MAKYGKASNTARNRLYYGDNLDVLRRHVAPESVDLVYLDPPFKSDQDYNVLFKDRGTAKDSAQFSAFEDTWRWSHEAEDAYHEATKSGGPAAKALVSLRGFLHQSDMMAYLSMMAPRLVELHRVMKPTAGIYLHCDPTASHYLKMLMDAVFGPGRFVNEIVWKRHNARSVDALWPRVHDVLLFYAKSDNYTFKPVRVQGDVRKLPHTLITGAEGKKYQTYELTGAGTRAGETGRPWRGFNPTSMGRHWGNLHGVMDRWDAAGEIHWPKGGGFPRRRAAEPFDEAGRTIVVGDVWTDIDRINQSAKERVGYPTQKPLALLQRIIEASSNPGDVVLDPFCGCGTTIDAAQRMGRWWIGIDVTSIAINVIKHRLMTNFGDRVGEGYRVIGEPADLAGAEQLAKEDTHQFEHWALGLVGARASAKRKGADQGIDGRLYFYDDHGDPKEIIVSVKSGKTSVKDVRDLRGVIEREKATMGVLITLQESTQPMRAEAAAAGVYESPWGGKHPRLQVLTIEELIDGADIDRPPTKAPAMVRKGTKSIPPPLVTDEPLTLESPTKIAAPKPAKAKRAKPTAAEVVELVKKRKR